MPEPTVGTTTRVNSPARVTIAAAPTTAPTVQDQFAAILLIADTWSTMVVLMHNAIDAARMLVALHTAFATSSDGHISADTQDDTQDAVMCHSDCPADLLHAAQVQANHVLGIYPLRQPSNRFEPVHTIIM